VTAAGRAGVALLSLAALAADPGWASHGGRDRLRLVPAGPYVLSAWTRPDPPTLEGFSVSVAVMRPDDRSPVLDATVRLVVAPADRGEPPRVVEAPRGAGSNRLYHEAQITVPRPGPWELAIIVEGPTGGGATVFVLDVEPSGLGRWLAVALAVVLLFGILVGLGWRAGRGRGIARAGAALPDAGAPSGGGRA
jgi:hypothetical protein